MDKKEFYIKISGPIKIIPIEGVCRICGESIDIEAWNYCPYCGAATLKHERDEQEDRKETSYDSGPF